MAVEEQQIVPADGADNELEEADRQLSELLVEKGRLKEPDLSRARRLQEESGESLVPLMVKLGLLSERDVAEGLAEMLELPLLGSKDYPDVPVTNGQLSERFLKQHHLVPLQEDDDTVVIAMADPRDSYPCQALGLATGKTVEVRIGVQSEIDDVIERIYGGGRSAMGQIVENLSEDDAAGEDDVEHLRDLSR